MDIASVIRHRLDELGIGQRELALAAEVTESYISQLLANKKMPPASSRSSIYRKIGKVLSLPTKELANLADAQRREQQKQKVLDPPQPLFQDFRRLILRKCAVSKREQITGMFKREPFGAFERFITQKLLDVAKQVTKQECENERWVQRVAGLSKRTNHKMRISIPQFLEIDIFHVSIENCISFLDPLIQRWDIDLATFSMEIAINRRLSRNYLKKLEFVEKEGEATLMEEPGLNEFLRDSKLSANITGQEVTFLKSLKIFGRRPSALYYYRELQNLRDPLNFLPRPIRTAQ